MPAKKSAEAIKKPAKPLTRKQVADREFARMARKTAREKAAKAAKRKQTAADKKAAKLPPPSGPATPENRKPEIPRTRDGKFPPGVSGNPGGRPKNTPVTDAFRTYLAMPVPGDKQHRSYGELIALAALNKALKGNIDAVKEVTDRVEGRSRQRLEHTGRDGGPIDISSLTPEERDIELERLAADLGYSKAPE